MTMRWSLRSTVLVAILLSSFAALTQLAQAQSTQAFNSKSFSAQYYLDRTAKRTSTLKVVETLVARFPDSDQNHGILRALPKTYQGHTTSLQVDSVTDETGFRRNYTTYSENNNLVLKIGDANTYVHGQQTYVITYRMRNIILLQKDHDEFYWDVNGDQWAQSFDQVSAEIHIPKEIATSMQNRQACYAGIYGQTTTNSCSISRQEKDAETAIVTSTKEPLGPYNTLTFALAFKDGTFELGPEVAHEAMVKKVKLGLSAIGVVLPPAIAFGLMFRRWRQFGDDPKGRGVIVPEYEPPKGFNVLISNFVLSQSISPKTLSAALIQLAVNKYIKISEISVHKRLRRDSTNYELEIVHSLDGADEYLKKIAKAVFEDTSVGVKTSIDDIKASTTRRTDIYKATTSLSDELAKELYQKDYFVKNPKAVKNSYVLWAIGPVIVGAFLAFIFGSAGLYPLAALGAGFILAGLVMFGFAFIMPARTLKGVEAHDALLGLKDYIKMAEADRLKFGQSVEGAEKVASGSFDPTSLKTQVKLFESLLPYAMLFGLEKSWAKQFEGIYANAPDWYSGNMHAFNVTYLASSLSDFSSASSVSFSSPTSSSSGGFSGGGAGGGGGGGGGGGW